MRTASANSETKRAREPMPDNVGQAELISQGEYGKFLKAIPKIDRVIFAPERKQRPKLAYQIPFPRIGFILSGKLEQTIGDKLGRPTQISQTSSMALFVPANGWNDPQWSDSEVEMLDLLFGKQRVGISLSRWDGEKQSCIAKFDLPRRGPRSGTFILNALNELVMRPQDKSTPVYLVRALVAHVQDLMNIQVTATSRSSALAQAIKEHIEDHFSEHLSRESVAYAFSITPNYLSHLFQKEFQTSFNEYLNLVRLEQAKHLLRNYGMTIKEVATSCGFTDSNYFCRLFRQKTDRSPSEYRMQYRSQPKPG
ncbi:AraC family transcriptional regulator [uncultured Cohaesibacter sp.]|uniref:helix-turn-helix domain-containing protein n=1 Tax=uncultured Cohaesibacter sp. TaxID=1002546 RepID=UPI0029C767C1|nr:AraC family transcriptional regulator [uncultured Cohaesibacter sp.]